MALGEERKSCQSGASHVVRMIGCGATMAIGRDISPSPFWLLHRREPNQRAIHGILRLFGAAKLLKNRLMNFRIAHTECRLWSGQTIEAQRGRLARERNLRGNLCRGQSCGSRM